MIRHWYILFVLLIWSAPHIWAEPFVVDSLKRVIADADAPEAKAKAYLALTEVMINLDPNRGRSYAQEALLAAEASQKRLLVAKCYNALGLIARYQGDLDASQRFHTRALIELEGLDSPKELSITHRQLGAAFHRQGKWDLAWEQYTYALEIAEDHKIPEERGNVFNNMGSLRRIQGNSKEALDYYQQALELILASETPMVVQESNIRNNIANIYGQEGRSEDALAAYKAVHALRIQANDSVGVVKVLMNIAKTFLRDQELDSSWHYNRLGIELAKQNGLKPEMLEGYIDLTYSFVNYELLDSALIYGQAAHSLAKEIGNRQREAETHLALGYVYMDLGQTDSALFYAKAAERRADTLGALDIRVRAYTLLREIHVGMNEYKLAYLYRDLEARLTDSLYYKDGPTLTVQLETQQELDQRTQQIERLNTQRRIQRNWWAAGTIFSLLVAIAVFMYLRVRAQKNVNSLLEEKNEAIRYQNYQLSVHNADLEQFAFAVSHNMREPLRTLGSYAGLVRRRYHDKLDDDGQTFLGFISGSAQHLHNLMSDLLTYVQLGKRPIHIIEVEMGSLLKKVKGRLAEQIQAAQAKVEVEKMPAIQGDPDSLFLLFQHLIQNALTFHDEQVPHVEISHKEGPGYHLF
ncbi:MAG: tetratricopeptide repeat protein, partial [Bacteroidota bacterium]